jgi:hypothetical protein
MNGRDDLVSAHAETPYSAVPVILLSPSVCMLQSLSNGLVP